MKFNTKISTAVELQIMHGSDSQYAIAASAEVSAEWERVEFDAESDGWGADTCGRKRARDETSESDTDRDSDSYIDSHWDARDTDVEAPTTEKLTSRLFLPVTLPA